MTTSRAAARTRRRAARDKGSVVVGGQDFTESQVLAAIYQQLLESEGYAVQTKLVTTRDVYLPELAKGNVDIVPDYLAGITDFLNTEANGAERRWCRATTRTPRWRPSSRSPRPRASRSSPPSEATDQNAFFVTTDFAEENDLETLSDLAALGRPDQARRARRTARAAPTARAASPTSTGFDITEIVPLDFASSQLKDAVANGEVQLGETGTTDGTLEDLGLVLLEDDKGIQPAQNLTPAVNSDFLADNPDLEDLFNALSEALTTEDLAEMNVKVDLERQKPEDVAADFLEDKGLI